MATQVLILIGFDYQGGGVDFAAMARNRQTRLLAGQPADDRDDDGRRRGAPRPSVR